MVLVVDIGNTKIKLGIFKDDKLIESARLSSSSKKTSDEYFLSIDHFFKQKKLDINDIEGAIISSVNPNINYTFEHLIVDYFHIKPLMVGSGVKTTLNIKYDNPKEVGTDRIVDSVAGYYTYGGPCIVIDCGTATTFNVVTEKAEFLGGCISYGLKSCVESLCSSAAKLPYVELVRPENVICKNTINNMQSGIINGYIGMVEYIVKKIKKELNNDNIKVVATGGLSEIVAEGSDIIDVVDRTLTLRGLNILYNINKKNDK